MLLEQVKDRLVLRVQQELEFWLREADETVNNGVTTPPPFVVYHTNRSVYDGYPAVELLAQASGNQAPNSSAQHYLHRILVQATLAGDDEGLLTRWAERYLWALRQLARSRPTDPALDVGEIMTGGEQYTLVERASGIESPFVKGGVIEWQVQTFEGPVA